MEEGQEQINTHPLKPAASILDELKEKANLEAQKRGPDIAGFWRRFLAFIIDGICIGVPLWLIAVVIGELFYALGPYGRFIGYAIYIPYLAFFNSRHMSGQTLGKRVTGIAVVDQDFKFLSLKKSTIRATLLGILLILNGWALPIFENPIFSFLATLIVTTGLLTMVYALIFNRTTRQGVHDLLLHTYVVKTPPNMMVKLPEIPRDHQILMYGMIGLGILIALSGLIFQVGIATLITNIGPQDFQDQLSLQQTLMDSNEFYSVEIDRINVVRPDRPIRELDIEIWAKTTCYGNPDYCDETVDWAARNALEKYPDAGNLTHLRVVLINQSDLGFLSGIRYYGAALTIEEWQSRLTE